MNHNTNHRWWMAWVTSAHVTADFPTAHDPTVSMRHASPCARFFICTAVVWYRMSYTNMTFARASECIRVRSLFVRICVARRTIELVRRTLRRCRIGRLITRARNANTHTHACTRTQYTARRWRHQPAVDAAPAAATAAANERVARARLYLESRTQRISWPLLFGSACCARPIHARPSDFCFPVLCSAYWMHSKEKYSVEANIEGAALTMSVWPLVMLLLLLSMKKSTVCSHIANIKWCYIYTYEDISVHR